MSETRDDILERAGEAALTLAADRPWPEITLRDIAAAAELSFAELYACVESKDRVLSALSSRFDAAALRASDAAAGDEDVHDRLFEATMARVEAIEPHRHALIAIARADRGRSVAPALPRTARALLEAAGIDASGVRGGVRRAAMTAVWARTLQVWRDDEGALNRTMAEIDKQLRAMRDRLGRVGAGF